MFEKEPVLARYSHGIKVLSLLLILIISLLFTTIFGMALALPFFGLDIFDGFAIAKDYSDPATIRFLKYFQVVNQLGLFIFPPVFFAFLVNRKILPYFRLNIKPDTAILFFAFAATFAILPFTSWLGEVNQAMKFPQSLSGIEEWMKNSEEEGMRLTVAFLSTKGIPALLFNVFMIAIIPGIGEELLFRGVVLKLFKDWTKNVHVAVIISSILFSALHLQFYGFLPRFVLGMFLGYLFVLSGTLWVPVIIHFINNAFAILYVYFTNSTETLTTEIESIGDTSNPLIIVFSFVVLVTLMFLILKRGKQLNLVEI